MAGMTRDVTLAAILPSRRTVHGNRFTFELPVRRSRPLATQAPDSIQGVMSTRAPRNGSAFRHCHDSTQDVYAILDARHSPIPRADYLPFLKKIKARS